VPAYIVFVTGQRTSHRYTASALPSIGETITPDDTELKCRIDAIDQTDGVGSIYCSVVARLRLVGPDETGAATP
jgi:hypothetical protein